MARIIFWVFLGLVVYSFLTDSSANNLSSAYGTATDPYAGTNRSREYQEAWERSREEAFRRHANEIPDHVRRILDTMPNSPGK